MVMRWVLTLVMGMCLVTAVVFGQGAAPAPSAPAVTADEEVMLHSLESLRVLANQACEQVDAYQQYRQAMNRISARFEANHPGYTMNWQTGLLVAKAPAKP